MDEGGQECCPLSRTQRAVKGSQKRKRKEKLKLTKAPTINNIRDKRMRSNGRERVNGVRSLPVFSFRARHLFQVRRKEKTKTHSAHVDEFDFEFITSSRKQAQPVARKSEKKKNERRILRSGCEAPLHLQAAPRPQTVRRSVDQTSPLSCLTLRSCSGSFESDKGREA